MFIPNRDKASNHVWQNFPLPWFSQHNWRSYSGQLIFCHCRFFGPKSASGSQGNVVNPGVNELVLPDYKHTWGNIRKLADATPQARAVSFKSKEYTS